MQMTHLNEVIFVFHLKHVSNVEFNSEISKSVRHIAFTLSHLHLLKTISRLILLKKNQIHTYRVLKKRRNNVILHY